MSPLESRYYHCMSGTRASSFLIRTTTLAVSSDRRTHHRSIETTRCDHLVSSNTGAASVVAVRPHSSSKRSWFHARKPRSPDSGALVSIVALAGCSCNQSHYMSSRLFSLCTLGPSDSSRLAATSLLSPSRVPLQAREAP